MINLEHLNVICVICDLGSFQAASEQLNKARSAISYSVKQLEENYQVKFFDRSEYRASLTKEGRLLLPKIRNLVAQAKQLEGHLIAMGQVEEVELKLGVGSNFPIRQLSSLLKDLKKNFPMTNIHLEIETASGERKLTQKQVDLAILTTPQKKSQLDYLQFDEMDFPLVIAKQLVGDQANNFGAHDLLNFPQVIVKSSDEKAPDRQILDDAQKWYVTDMHAKKDLICDGLGWGRMPRHMIQEALVEEQLFELDVLGELKLPIYIAKLNERSLGPVGLYIWQYFANLN